MVDGKVFLNLIFFFYFIFSLSRCEDGYQLATQTSSLSCQSDGTWSKHSIRCRPTPCLLPTNFSIPHVIITGKELTPVGGTITLSCPPGLYLQGSALAECQVGKMLDNYLSKSPILNLYMTTWLNNDYLDVLSQSMSMQRRWCGLNN